MNRHAPCARNRAGVWATGFLAAGLLGLACLLPGFAAAAPADLEDRVREIASELRCVVCQNLSVAD
ncbi:MAG TPA: cytochrome c-type biogenesis protein CcmH, partial [Candidatus Methylomirabilis sp.]